MTKLSFGFDTCRAAETMLLGYKFVPLVAKTYITYITCFITVFVAAKFILVQILAVKY